MKFPKFIMALLIITTLFTKPALGHSGRTDGSGGHRDNKNASGLGYYHYHHGMGPHLHPNGICPYTNGGNSSNRVQYDPKQEYDKGYKVGYDRGYQMGYNEDYNQSTFSYENTSYRDGYKKGYDDGFSKGLSDKKLYREKILRDDYEKGLLEGSNIDSPSTAVIPIYSKDIERQKSYTKGFNDSIDKLLKGDYDSGYKTGKEKYSEQCPFYSGDEKRNSSYQNGFVAAQKDYYIGEYKEVLSKLNKEAFNDGYNQAFEAQPVEVPDNYKSHFIGYFRNIGVFKNMKDDEIISLKNSNKINDEVLLTSFKEGFNSNKEINEMSGQGLKDGLLFQKPKTLDKGQKIYDPQYSKGRTMSLAFCGVIGIAGILAYIFIRRKQRI